MIKKTITYTDFNDKVQTEDFYFNLTKAEMIEMELSGDSGSLSDDLKAIGNSGNGALIISTFKGILEKAYGVKSDDGKRFIKTPESFLEFSQSEPYSELFVQFVTDSAYANEFVNGLMANLGDIEIPNNQPEVTVAPTATPSELARKASEENMQGYKKKDHEGSEINDVATPAPEEDLSMLSRAELLDRLSKK